MVILSVCKCWIIVKKSSRIHIGVDSQHAVFEKSRIIFKYHNLSILLQLNHFLATFYNNKTAKPSSLLGLFKINSQKTFRSGDKIQNGGEKI
jgi:hypothetical protein